MAETVRHALDGGLFTMTLCRPPLNILHGPMMAELIPALEAAAEAGDAKVMLLRAEGKAFSAGADIDEHRPGKAETMIDQFHDLFRAIDQIPYPTVAFVQGAALGGGCELAMGCDIVVATERAKFGQPEIGLGFLPPVAAALLPWKVGWAKAMEMCCTGQPLKAQEAQAAGLVNHVFAEEGAEEALSAYLAPFLKQSPVTLRLTKKALRGGGHLGRKDRIAFAEKVFLGELMKTQDVLEGLAAFDEKREPRWKNA
jgi:cyclohexa-1,5-dienecarbonyl-CoA hydratase